MKQTQKIKTAVVEDDARIRRVLTEVFASATDCECVGMFRNGTAAIAGIPALQPDVIIMDINLPDLSGVECVARLAPQLPGSQILMLTVYQDTETIFQALSAGAHGYLVKPVLPEQLLAAVSEIHSGGAPISPRLPARSLTSSGVPRQHQKETRQRLIRLWRPESDRCSNNSSMVSPKRKSRPNSPSASPPSTPTSSGSTRSSTSAPAAKSSPAISLRPLRQA